MIATSINDLPVEMLEKVMTNLSTPDLLTCRRVCQKWYEATYSPRFVKMQGIAVEQMKDLRSYRPTSRHYNVRVGNMNMAIAEAQMDTNFWSTHGDEIKSLILENADIDHPAVAEILVSCTSLKSLKITGCRYSLQHDHSWKRSLRNMTLPILTELTIVGISIEAGNLIDALLRKTQCLRLLSINNVHCRVDDLLHGRGVPFSWEILVSAVERNPTIETLEITKSCLTGDILRNIVNAIDPKLTSLNMDRINSRCNEDAAMESGYIAIYEKLINLERINLTDNFVDGDVMDAILTALPKLREISFPTVYLPEQLSFLKYHNDLTHVNITGYRDLPRDYLTNAFASKQRPRMLSLVLDEIYCVDDVLMGQICPMLPNLEELGVRWCRVGNGGLKIISQCNRELKALWTLSHPLTTLSGEDWSINDLRKLVLLEIEPCVCFQLDLSAVVRTLRLGKLKRLRMNYNRATQADFDVLRNNCPSIELDQCWRIHENLEGLLKPTRIFSRLY